jgi:hypothetical protein
MEKSISESQSSTAQEVRQQSVATPTQPPEADMTNPDHVARLLLAYQVDRQDDQVALQVAFGIVAAALGYMGLVAAYLLDHPDASPITRYVAPSIAVALAGFLVLNVSATRIRSVALQRLEDKLALRLDSSDNAPLSPHLHSEYGLVYRPDYKGPQKVRHIFALVTIISYTPILLAVAGFTILALAPGAWDTWKILVAIVYGLAELVLLAAMFISTMRKHPSFSLRKDARSRQPKA